MNQRETDPRIGIFFERLSRLEAGERARLKRCAGQALAEARRDGLGLFYSIVPAGVPEYQHESYFLVATLYPIAEGGAAGNFGASLRQARQTNNEKGLDRRVIALLDADEQQLPFRLRQATHFLKSNRARVNWPQLLEDLLAWNYTGRAIQRRWAQSYFAE